MVVVGSAVIGEGALVPFVGATVGTAVPNGLEVVMTSVVCGAIEAVVDDTVDGTTVLVGVAFVVGGAGVLDEQFTP